MKLPKQVLILGQKYSVIQQNDLKSESNEVWGSVDLEAKKIFIEQNQHPYEKISTLIHEIGHAIFKESAIGLTNISAEIEEILVEQMAKAITENFFKKQRASPKAKKTKPSKTTTLTKKQQEE